MTPKQADETPTNARAWVVVFAVSLAVLSYVSRVCISMAAPEIRKDLHLSTNEMGQIFGAFAISYALLEIPSGLLGDWIGAKKVLIRIVLWWSAFTALTGAMWNFWALYAVRFLFGAGEAGAFPNLTKIFTIWLPHRERLRAQAIMWTSARWAGAFTPKLVFLVLLIMNWRTAFFFFGAVGVIWVAVFYWWFRDDPHTHPSVNAAEAALIGGTSDKVAGHGNVPWGKLLRSRSVWLLWVQYFALSFPWYFYITWMPSYLKDYWKLGGSEATTLAILPLFLGGLGSAFCGWVSRPLALKAGGPRMSRRILACTGFLGAGLLMIAAIQMKSAVWAMVAMGMSSFFNDLAMPPSWASCMDIGGKYAGTLSGSMNMMGNLAGFASPVIGGRILHDDPTRFSYLLYLSAAVYFIGLLCWPFIDPVTPLEPEED